MPSPITVHTFGDLIRRGYRLAVLCDDCRRTAELEATALPLARPYAGVRFLCRCGARCRPILTKPLLLVQWAG